MQNTTNDLQVRRSTCKEQLNRNGQKLAESEAAFLHVFLRQVAMQIRRVSSTKWRSLALGRARVASSTVHLLPSEEPIAPVGTLQAQLGEAT